ncbi:MAG: hypothetical protein DSZ05_07990 [Sulfurospirillum sp.]|nr:MAG: hypothetical protein DSZ05_07990 [Sulfurospirillum sp.]
MGKLFSKRYKRKILLLIAPPLVYGIIRLLYASCTKRFHLPASKPPTPALVAFWHGEILMNPFIYRKFMKDQKYALMISEHFDGELIARAASFFGFDFVRGSSSKGAVKALKESFRLIDQGIGLAITPDGPRGPRHSIADGIVAIAQKKRLPIVVYRYTASRFWQLKSWDKFVIPKPFSTLDFYASEPFYVTDMEKEKAKELIKERLESYV